MNILQNPRTESEPPGDLPRMTETRPSRLLPSISHVCLTARRLTGTASRWRRNIVKREKDLSGPLRQFQYLSLHDLTSRRAIKSLLATLKFGPE